MRLINTETLDLVTDPPDLETHPYAILSHRWGPPQDEVNYQDWMYARGQDEPRWGWNYSREEVKAIKARPGYAKIRSACRQARRDGYDWLWVDTNCIDKTSSAELSESINSMYRWYQHAAVCYAFLDDVQLDTGSDILEQCSWSDSKFQSSRWFTRGWTLQELIAPQQLVFFSSDWQYMFTKELAVTLLCKITGISQMVLNEPRNLHCKCRGGTGHVCVAEIFSWAKGRTTGKAEDRAYCLMGLLDVQMPLLYGEGGDNAFFRLQQQVVLATEDPTILVWEHTGDSIAPHGAFAPSVDSFGSSKGFSMPGKRRIGMDLPELNWNSDTVSTIVDCSARDLTIHLPLIDTMAETIKFAVLPFEKDGHALWMPLQKHGDRFVRLSYPELYVKVNPLTPNHFSKSKLRIPYKYHITGTSVTQTSRDLPGISVDVQLTFPAGLGSFRVSQLSPNFDGHDASLFQLRTMKLNEDPTNVAYGIIEFTNQEKPERVVSIFFGAQFGEAPCYNLKKWTCFDACKGQTPFQLFPESPVEGSFPIENLAESLTMHLLNPKLDDRVNLQWSNSNPLFSDYQDNRTGKVSFVKSYSRARVVGGSPGEKDEFERNFRFLAQVKFPSDTFQV